MTRIYGTLGPKCSDYDTLVEMFRNGMTGIRLNLSHTTLEASGDLLKRYFKAAETCHVVPELLIDMQGPELRTGKLNKSILLEPDSEILLGDAGIPVPEIVLSALKPGQEILLDDGKILLRVSSVGISSAVCLVLRGGELKSRKSIALPGVHLNPPAITEEDLQNLSIAAACGVTAVMQPFVRSAEDLRNVRKALYDAGAEHIRIFAKIENMDGVEHLDELIKECDEIVIARGDLGNAVPLWELPRVQKEISEKCKKANMPFMVVTQMLSSMEHSSVPTRAEVSDIFNAVCDGCASVMVTGETAAGEYPAEVIKYLANTVEEAERYLLSEDIP